MANIGLEIELVMPMGSRSFREVTRSYHGESADHLLGTGWKCKTDSSIDDYDRDTEFGIEVVSPVMSATDPATFSNINRVLRVIRENGGYANDTCGLHVHVDARSLNRHEIEAIKQFFRVHEFGVFGVNGEDIEHRMISEHAQSYCRPSTMWGSRRGHDARYHSLNLTNIGSDEKNTVECRCYASTIEPSVVFGAISVFYAITQRAIIASRKGYRIPDPNYDLRIPSPVESMNALVDGYFAHDELLPSMTRSQKREICDALKTRAEAAEATLNKV